MTRPLTIAELLRAGAAELREGSDSARLDAELLLGQVLGRSRTALVARGDEPVPPAEERRFRALLERRRGGVPVAYLTGRREFWSLELKVTPDVLVPRPETEVLVEAALAHLPPGGEPSVLDLGTGSGAIALAIASERPHASVTATDVSAEALAVARANAAALGLERIAWRRGSWFDAVPGGRFDVIVSNPPYVAAADPAIARLASEPLAALTPGPTGLEAIERIAADAGRHLRADGMLAFEHGAVQADAVASTLAGRGFRAIRTLPDASGLPRVTLGFLSTSAPRTTT